LECPQPLHRKFAGLGQRSRHQIGLAGEVLIQRPLGDAGARGDPIHPVLKPPFSVKDGFIEIPERPGLGIEWDDKAVARYRY
jgi:hypothetical protein